MHHTQLLSVRPSVRPFVFSKKIKKINYSFLFTTRIHSINADPVVVGHAHEYKYIKQENKQR